MGLEVKQYGKESKWIIEIHETWHFKDKEELMKTLKELMALKDQHKNPTHRK